MAVTDEKDVKPFIYADDIRQVAKTDEIVDRLETVEDQADKNSKDIRKIARTDELVSRIEMLEALVKTLTEEKK